MSLRSAQSMWQALVSPEREGECVQHTLPTWMKICLRHSVMYDAHNEKDQSEV